MQVLVTLVHEGGEPQDVMVTTDDAATAGDVAQALTAALGSARQPPGTAPPNVVVPMPGTSLAGLPGYGPSATAVPSLWADGLRCDRSTSAASVLRDGMRVSVDDTIGPLLRRGEPDGWYELRVAGGPASGHVVRLGAGVATIGSATTCSLALRDSSLPSVAIRLTIDVQGAAVLSPQSGTGVQLDDEAVESKTPWPLGSVVRVGDCLLVLDRAAGNVPSVASPNRPARSSTWAR